MKKLLTMAMLFVCLNVMADDYAYPFLIFETANGTTSVALESIILTIEDGKLKVTNSETSEQFLLTDITKMYFSTSASTGIENLTTEWSNGQATEIYTIGGCKMGTAPLSFLNSKLPKGIYIVKENGKTRKVVLK